MAYPLKKAIIELYFACLHLVQVRICTQVVHRLIHRQKYLIYEASDFSFLSLWERARVRVLAAWD
jgi:hypothetical protein